MEAYKYYKDLPGWAKGAVVVGGALIAFLLGKQVYNIIDSKLRQGKMLKEGKEAGGELINLGNQGVHPSITDAQAEGYANSLQAAFGGCGTDEGAIMNVFNAISNEADVYLLISKYGLRKYDACNWTDGFGDKESTLNAAISDELDSDEKDALNSILQAKGIKYRFS